MTEYSRIPITNTRRVREILNYDPQTGVFTRRVTRRGPRAHVGDVAGTLKARGYIELRVDNRIYKAHRIAWLYVYGKWPTTDIDHINGIPSDNRIANLREATPHENQQNRRAPNSQNTSGYLGVTWHKASGKWRARITVNNDCKLLGYFASAELAYNAYLAAKRQLHPFGEI